MHKYLLLLLLLVGAVILYSASQHHSIELKDNEYSDDRYYTDESQSNVYWIGPGYYGGIRFNNEEEFNVWKRTWSNDGESHGGRGGRR